MYSRPPFFVNLYKSYNLNLITDTQITYIVCKMCLAARMSYHFRTKYSIIHITIASSFAK